MDVLMLCVALAFPIRGRGQGAGTLTVVAQSGQAGLTSIGNNVSIDDSGLVAFAGSGANGAAAFVAGGTGGVTQVIVGAGGKLGQYVQINNSGNVATVRGPYIITTDPIYEYVPILGYILVSPGYSDSLFFFQLVNAAGSQLIKTFESADARVVDYGNYDNLGGPFSYLGPAVTVNNNNQAAFVGNEGVGFNDDYVLATPIDGTNVNAVPIPLIAQPMIADDGSIVCQNGSGAAAPIVRFDYTLTTAETIASTAQGFSALGLAPGISDDATYIAFYGVTAQATTSFSSGPGISFLNHFHWTSTYFDLGGGVTICASELFFPMERVELRLFKQTSRLWMFHWTQSF
ncbi:MAG TPA: hypothetical protein VN765_01560 [Candidatus Acidoferrum sp.]|nr:hypothetical protein [Candidatus Acidoferrum sp.]